MVPLPLVVLNVILVPTKMFLLTLPVPLATFQVHTVLLIVDLAHVVLDTPTTVVQML